MIRKCYKVRIYPNKTTTNVLERDLDLCRGLYNAALQERKEAWSINRISVSCFEQIKQLVEIKQTNPEYQDINNRVLCQTLRQLERSFNAFFRRIKKGEKSGFPRFKAASRFNCLIFNTEGFWLEGNRLRLSKVGSIKAKLSQPILGKIKETRIIRSGRKWFAVFFVETEAAPLPLTGEEIGVDVGIENFATLSDGTQIENWRFYESEQKKLRTAQRRVARRKKGSNRRRKAVAMFRTIHEKIRNQREDFQHKISTHLVKNYDLIAAEKLNVKGMSRGILSKQILDVGWGEFLQKLKYKAEWAGKTLREVNPAYTSQTCLCGKREKKTLAQRWHNCECGVSMHRDHLSAQIILQLGRSCQALTKAAGLRVA